MTDILHIVGAGPAGLAAGIVGAKAGLEVVVHERAEHVGSRFHGDFQGLENWSQPTNVIRELLDAGIAPTFENLPVREIVSYDPEGRGKLIRSPHEPFFYLVRRGPDPGTLDHALAQQALALGVDIRFRDHVDHLPEGGIVARGPRGADVIAVGYIFDTDQPDSAYVVMNENLAPGGYAYLLIWKGRATVATCMFSDFHREKLYLERTVKFFRDRIPFRLTHALRFGGTGRIGLPASVRRGNMLLVGEAAGLQDALWGFGLRYALGSGSLASRSIAAGRPEFYERIWRHELKPKVEAGLVNRALYARLGNSGYRLMLGHLAQSRDPRQWLRSKYAPSPWKSFVCPWLRSWIGSPPRAVPCDSACDCTWCRCERDGTEIGNGRMRRPDTGGHDRGPRTRGESHEHLPEHQEAAAGHGHGRAAADGWLRGW